MADSTSPTTVSQNLPKFDTDEVLFFLQGFNGSMLEHDQPIWAIAVPVTICCQGDAQIGRAVQGYSFQCDAADACELSEGASRAIASDSATHKSKADEPNAGTAAEPKTGTAATNDFRAPQSGSLTAS